MSVKILLKRSNRCDGEKQEENTVLNELMNEYLHDNTRKALWLVVIGAIIINHHPMHKNAYRLHKTIVST